MTRKSLLFILAGLSLQSAAAHPPGSSPAKALAEAVDCSDKLDYLRGSLATDRQIQAAKIKEFAAAEGQPFDPVLSAYESLILRRIQQALPRHKSAAAETGLIHEIETQIVLSLGNFRENYLLRLKELQKEEEPGWARFYEKDLREYLAAQNSRIEYLIKRVVDSRLTEKPEPVVIKLPHPVTGVDEFIPTQALRSAMQRVLNEQELKVIDGVFFQELRLAEIGWEMDKSSEWVRQTLKNALLKLKRALEHRALR